MKLGLSTVLGRLSAKKRDPMKDVFTAAERSLLFAEARAVLQAKKSLYERVQRRDDQLASINVELWRKAQRSARMLHTPDRRDLLNIFRDALLDAHLAGAIRTQRERVLAMTPMIYQANGSPDVPASELLNGRWFRKLVRYVLEAELYGFSLVELCTVQTENGPQPDVVLIPRGNVIPEYGVVRLDESLPTPFSLSGRRPEALPGTYIKIEELPQLVMIHGTQELGLLDAAVPLVIWKRNSLGLWAEHQEKFSVPPLVGKTRNHDLKKRQQLKEMLENLISSSAAVIDEEDNVEALEVTRTDVSKIYHELIDVVNEELSKLINGQTLTADAGERGARSLGDVHMDVYDDVIRERCQAVEAVMNEQLMPAMFRYFPAYSRQLLGKVMAFDLDYKLPLIEQWKIDQGLLQSGYDIPIDFLQERYGTPLELARPSQPQTPIQPNDNGQGGAGIPFPGGLQAQPFERSSASFTLLAATTGTDDDPLIGEIERIIRAAYGSSAPPAIDQRLFEQTAAELMRAVEAHFQPTNGGIDYSSPDEVMYQALRTNVYLFSGAKTWQQMQAINSELLDERGRLRAFNDFRERVLGVHRDYNLTWLRTEYEQALASSQMASRWLRIRENEATLPLLQYRTVADDRVREQHRRWHRITLPVSHAFWQTHFPPNGWNCRCDVRQLRSGQVTPEDQLGGIEPPPALFRGNPGTSGVIFGAEHPYFQQQAIERARAAGLLFPVDQYIIDKRDPLTRQFFNQDVQVFAPDRMIVAGRELADEDIARLFGALDGSEILIDALNEDGEDFAITIRHPLILNQQRYLRYRDGGWWMENYVLRLREDAPRGLGARIAAHQMRAAIELGLEGIEVSAVRADETGWNGYYTWPRLGYNNSIPSWFRRQFPEVLEGMRDMIDVMRNPETRELWRIHGNDINVEFPANAASKEYKYHLEYLRQNDVSIDK